MTCDNGNVKSIIPLSPVYIRIVDFVTFHIFGLDYNLGTGYDAYGVVMPCEILTLRWQIVNDVYFFHHLVRKVMMVFASLMSIIKLNIEKLHERLQ